MPEKKQLRFIILAVIVLGTFLSLVASSGCSKKPATGVSSEAELTEVNTILVKKSFLDNQFIFPGKIEALQSANIVAKVPGKVATVQVDLGSKVAAGQVLVTLENKDLADRVQQARAGIEQAQAASKLAQAALQAAEAGLATAQANFEVAEANYQRGQELLAAQAIPEAVFQAEYELRYKQAKEQAEKALPAQIKTAHAQADQAQAGLKSAQASLSLARTAYEDSFIRAPFSGVIAARNINPGEMASLAVPLISLLNLNKVAVKINV
ncbi:MAG TPA: hypothetical protein DCK87_02885, partial [Desulfotomaculum sp.]|nr:hypothetical protein [Desulfotomaculum sp.]